jgi:hypothetical protein
MTNPTEYDLCPTCGAPGISRERRIDGNDRCKNGHVYPSRLAVRPNTPPVAEKGWYGFDLDGTLAHYDGWKGQEHIGKPIAPMVDLVKRFLDEGKNVKIFTDRFANGPEQVAIIQDWCEKHIGRRLEVTNVKDWHCIRIYDDRCVQVVTNEGTLVNHELAA